MPQWKREWSPEWVFRAAGICSDVCKSSSPSINGWTKASFFSAFIGMSFPKETETGNSSLQIMRLHNPSILERQSGILTNAVLGRGSRQASRCPLCILATPVPAASLGRNRVPATAPGQERRAGGRGLFACFVFTHLSISEFPFKPSRPPPSHPPAFPYRLTDFSAGCSGP